MRYLFLFVFILFIISCNNSAKKNEPQDTTTRSDTASKTVINQPPTGTDTLFTGFGNEPFWAVYVINNDKILYHPADGPDISVPFVAASTPDEITRKYNSKNDSIVLELTITRKNCSDGMSDLTHPYEVTLLINALRRSGCGNDGTRR